MHVFKFLPVFHIASVEIIEDRARNVYQRNETFHYSRWKIYRRSQNWRNAKRKRLAKKTRKKRKTIPKNRIQTRRRDICRKQSVLTIMI